ncbi:MAG: ferredoxin reductase family protein [Candidatus Brocadiaceae bacterium]|nr:ferredoxin reductase family protein [Candidatus Brocadiaceae bacterium]
MWQGIGKIVLYVGIVLIPLFLRTIFRPNAFFPVTYEIGRNFALIGFTILLLQILLAGRFQWITKPFGLDIVIRFHNYIALFATSILILHPVLIAYGGDRWKLLYSLDVEWYIWAGRITLMILVIHVMASSFQAVLRISFETWRLIHDVLAPLILIVAFIHVWNVGDYIQAFPARLYWCAIFGVSLLLLLYHRGVRPFLIARSSYTVQEVIRETSDVWTIKLTPPKGKKRFDYKPGQFQFITFRRGRGLPEEEHHWTISSSPTEQDTVSATIKELGDFTATIGKTRQGDRADIHAPFGRFSYVFHPKEEGLIFFAGGIGITPFMSMLLTMRDTRSERNVVLMYGNKTEKDIVFYTKLAEIEQGGFPRLKVVHVLENPEKQWNGETGFIDREKIIRFCNNNLVKNGYYVCGPPVFIDIIMKTLRDLGVPRNRIHHEIFSLLG